MIRNTLKRIPWLLIFYSLLAITVINLILAYHFLTPPVEYEPTIFWPIAFYSKIIIPLILFLPVGFLFTIVVYLLRKKWMEAFASFLVMLMVTYLSLSVLFSFSIFELIDSLQIDTETVHVGAVGNLDGGNFLAFCSEREGKGTCEYFFTQYWLDGSPKLNLETDSKNVLVSLQDTIIYQYDGRFPGRCIVTAEKLVSGNCGSYFHGGNSGR